MDKRGLNHKSRTRQCNYSSEEKNLLMTLFEKYKPILTNKKTDAISNSKKEDAWKKIAIEFNAVEPNNTRRNEYSLKKAYINIRNTRKYAAKLKMQKFKNLEDLCVQKDNTSDTDTRLSDAKVPVDIEQFLPEHEIVIENHDVLQSIADANDLNIWNDFKPQNLQQILDRKLDEETEEVADVQIDPEKDLTENVKVNSDVKLLYTKLCEERLKIAQLEKVALENKIRSDSIKQELEIEILRTELEIKKEELKKRMSIL